MLDVILYTNPQQWFDRKSGKFIDENITLLWLILHHKPFLERFRGDEPKSGLHERFARDDRLRH